MTIGIYILRFIGTDLVYIGQSIHCEDRYRRHLYSLKNSMSASKLQQAYNKYGEPTMEILIESKMEELDSIEKEAISIFNSVESGFNMLPGGSTLAGINNPQAKYGIEDYYNVLCLLGTPGIGWKEISKATGVSEYVISHISSIESHTWLKEKFPEEYTKILNIRKNGGRNSAFMQGIRYPRIVSPKGDTYEVHHVTNFAKEHGLLQPKLNEVLNNKRGTHRGWHLESYVKKPEYPKIRDPDGNIYSIEYGQAAEFARKFGLTHALLHKVLVGTQKTHKGWSCIIGKVE